MKKKTKGFLAALTAAAIAVGMLSGCKNAAPQTDGSQTAANVGGNTTADAETGAGTTELTFWYSWTDKIQENNIALTEEFNKTAGKEKGIHVTAEYQGTYEDLHQKLQAAYIAKETPDVTVMEIASVRTFAQNGVLQPLDEYISKSGMDISDFHDGLMKNSYVDGSCYGIPYLRSTPIIYLNETLLKKAGLQASDMKTWDDMKKFAETVHSKTGKYGISIWSYVWPFEAFMLEYGSSVLSADENSSNMDGNEAKEIVNYFKDLQDSGACKIYLKADSDKVKSDVMNQNAAIWYGSTGDFTYYKQVAADCGFELACNFFPMKKSYGVTSGGCNLIMPGSIPDEKKAAAWEFMQWMTAKEQTITASVNTGYLPTRKSAAESDAMDAIYAETPQYKVALDQLAYSTGRPMNPGYAEAANEIEQALDAMWVNGADTDTTLANLAEKMNRLLKE